MSPSRWAVSCFIVWHVVSLSVRALPPPDLLPEVKGASDRPGHDSPAAARVLDAVAAWLRPVVLSVVDLTAPVSRLPDTYLRGIGFAQQWRMFSLPPVVYQYVRLRYYVGQHERPAAASSPADWMASELVVPAHREDRVRLVRSYRDSSRDKALMVALENFHRARESLTVRSDMRSSELPDFVAPVTRYFARRFERDHLLSTERIVRTELWYGFAPIPPPGSATDASRQARQAVLSKYYAGPVEFRGAIPAYPHYLAHEQEGDIIWTLDYYEEP